MVAGHGRCHSDLVGQSLPEAAVDAVQSGRYGGLESRVGTVVQVLLGLLLVATVVGVLVSPMDGIFYFPRDLVAWSLAVVVVLAGVVVVLARAPVARVVAIRGGWWLAVPFAALSSWAAVWIAHHIQYAYAWDARTLWRFADQLEAGEHSAYLGFYLSRYPNNVAMLAVDRVTLKLAGALDVPRTRSPSG